MAPGAPLAAVQHLIRRTHPALPPLRRELARTEFDADALRAVGDRRLRSLVALAARRSPYYRRWFAESGVDPASIRTADDLPRLPLLERETVAAAPADFRTRPAATMWPARSCGTSGTVVTVYRTPASSVAEMAALERQWAWFGLPPRPRRATLRGAGVGDALTVERPGANQLLVSSFHLTPEYLPEILSALRAWRPDALDGWPSSLTLLAGLLAEAGEHLPVRAVITSSEVLTDTNRALLTDVFGGPVVDHYGQTERVALAGNCEAGGMHAFSDYGVLELLPVPGSPDRFEIVGTPLRNRGFPVFRYRTGDEVTRPPDGPCPCGRAFPLLGRIDGRAQDRLTAADGRPIPGPATLIIDLIGMREVQIAQRAPGDFELRMVPGPGFDGDAVRARARSNLDRMVGAGERLTFREMERIPRPPGGKLRPAVVLAPGDP